MIDSKKPDCKCEVFKLFAVVVLFKLKPSESAAFKTLQAAVVHDQHRRSEIKILLYDNTPGGQDTGVLPADVLYKMDTKNGGLAKAYNYAIDVADKNGFDWLLTLDQDTSLPIDFISKLRDVATLVGPQEVVAAIVPRLVSDGRPVSPGRLLKPWGHVKVFVESFTGISSDETIAANSASTLRVSALKSLGGYDPRFAIWCSDIVMYHRLHCSNFRAYIDRDIVVDHVLAGLDLKTRSNPVRFEDACRSEEAFYDEYMGWICSVVLALKLCLRLVYGLRKAGGTLPYFKIGLHFLCRRLFYSRRRRIENWRQLVKQTLAVGKR